MGLGGLLGCFSDRGGVNGGDSSKSREQSRGGKESTCGQWDEKSQTAEPGCVDFKVLCFSMYQEGLLSSSSSQCTMQLKNSSWKLGGETERPFLAVKVLTPRQLANQLLLEGEGSSTPSSAGKKILIPQLISLSMPGPSFWQTGEMPGDSWNPHRVDVGTCVDEALAWLESCTKPLGSKDSSSNPRHPPLLFLQPLIADQAAHTVLQVKRWRREDCCTTLQGFLHVDTMLAQHLARLAMSSTCRSNMAIGPLYHVMKEPVSNVHAIQVSSSLVACLETGSLEPAVTMELFSATQPSSVVPRQLEALRDVEDSDLSFSPNPAPPLPTTAPRSVDSGPSGLLAPPSIAIQAEENKPVELSPRGFVDSIGGGSATAPTSITPEDTRDQDAESSGQGQSTEHMSKMSRAWMLLDAIPMMATMLSEDGSNVLCQNEASKLFWGSLVRKAGGCQLLSDLYGGSEDKLNGMLEALAHGEQWRGVQEVISTIPSPSPFQHGSPHSTGQDSSGDSAPMAPLFPRFGTRGSGPAGRIRRPSNRAYNPTLMSMPTTIFECDTTASSSGRLTGAAEISGFTPSVHLEQMGSLTPSVKLEQIKRAKNTYSGKVSFSTSSGNTASCATDTSRIPIEELRHSRSSKRNLSRMPTDCTPQGAMLMIVGDALEEESSKGPEEATRDSATSPCVRSRSLTQPQLETPFQAVGAVPSSQHAEGTFRGSLTAPAAQYEVPHESSFVRPPRAPMVQVAPRREETFASGHTSAALTYSASLVMEPSHKLLSMMDARERLTSQGNSDLSSSLSQDRFKSNPQKKLNAKARDRSPAFSAGASASHSPQRLFSSAMDSKERLFSSSYEQFSSQDWPGCSNSRSRLSNQRWKSSQSMTDSLQTGHLQHINSAGTSEGHESTASRLMLSLQALDMKVEAEAPPEAGPRSSAPAWQQDVPPPRKSEPRTNATATAIRPRSMWVNTANSPTTASPTSGNSLSQKLALLKSIPHPIGLVSNSPRPSPRASGHQPFDYPKYRLSNPGVLEAGRAGSVSSPYSEAHNTSFHPSPRYASLLESAKLASSNASMEWVGSPEGSVHYDSSSAIRWGGNSGVSNPLNLLSLTEMPRSGQLPVPSERKDSGSGTSSALLQVQGHRRMHDVHAIPVTDPFTNTQAILLLQSDITERALLEIRLAALSEAQLSMLEAMFPRTVLEFLMSSPNPGGTLKSLACSHDNVTIMFMDIVGFTDMSKRLSPGSVMGYLNELFTLLDDLVDKYGVYKVDTSGDCYIVAGGLMTRDADDFMTFDLNPDPQIGAAKVLAFTQALMKGVSNVVYPHSGKATMVRVGIHTGSCVSGLIGTKLPKFSLWGDTMNTASRMESTAQPGCVQVSEATYNVMDSDLKKLFMPSGGVTVKGKGSMQTYLLRTDMYQPSQEPSQLFSRQNSRQASLESSRSPSHLQSVGENVVDSVLSPFSAFGNIGGLNPSKVIENTGTSKDVGMDMPRASLTLACNRLENLALSNTSHSFYSLKRLSTWDYAAPSSQRSSGSVYESKPPRSADTSAHHSVQGSLKGSRRGSLGSPHVRSSCIADHPMFEQALAQAEAGRRRVSMLTTLFEEGVPPGHEAPSGPSSVTRSSAPLPPKLPPGHEFPMLLMPSYTLTGQHRPLSDVPKGSQLRQEPARGTTFTAASVLSPLKEVDFEPRKVQDLPVLLPTRCSQSFSPDAGGIQSFAKGSTIAEPGWRSGAALRGASNPPQSSMPEQGPQSSSTLRLLQDGLSAQRSFSSIQHSNRNERAGQPIGSAERWTHSHRTSGQVPGCSGSMELGGHKTGWNRSNSIGPVHSRGGDPSTWYSSRRFSINTLFSMVKLLRSSTPDTLSDLLSMENVAEEEEQAAEGHIMMGTPTYYSAVNTLPSERSGQSAGSGSLVTGNMSFHSANLAETALGMPSTFSRPSEDDIVELGLPPHLKTADPKA